MQTAPPGWLPDAGTEPEAVIREARRRQRRRWLAAGAAMVTVAAGAVAVLAGSGAGGHPRPPGRPATVTVKPAPSALSGLPIPAGSSVRLLLTGRHPAWFSLATGQAEPIKGLPGDRWGYFFTKVVGGWSAQPGTAGPACAMCPGAPLPNYFIADSSSRAARIAPGYEVAAADSSGAVWLITFPRSGVNYSTTPARAQEVTTAGRPLGPRVRLPAGYLFRRAVGGDLLLAPVLQPGQRPVTYQLWDPAARRVVRTFSNVIAAGPRQIAWPAWFWNSAEPICGHCPVHVRDLLTGTTATTPLPGGTWASNQGTFSADGRYLAVLLWTGAAPDGEPALTRIAVIDSTSRRLIVVPGTTLSWDDAIGRLIFGWQPGGHRLIAVLPGSGETIQVASWQPGQARLWVATARIPPGTSAVLGEDG
jgi:hypothetical protein